MSTTKKGNRPYYIRAAKHEHAIPLYEFFLKTAQEELGKKIVSGTFERNIPYLHVRNKQKVKFSSPKTFFAERKEIVDISYPGDIVGLHDTGNFKIGD